MNILEKIRSEYGNLSTKNRKIADTIMTNSESIISWTAQEIAESSSTSPATVIRFAKNLGYAGLDEMKYALAGIQSDFEKVINPIISKEDSAEEILGKVSILLINTIEDLSHSLDMSQLAAAIDSIREAQHVYCLGIGGSSLPAYNLYHKLNRAGKKTFFNFEPQMSIEFLHFSSYKDVVIAFSYGGESKEVLIACEIAKKQNAKIIAITKNPLSSLATLSDYILVVPNNEYALRIGAVSSLNSSMTTSDLLYLGTIQPLLGDNLDQKIFDMTNLITKLGKE